MCDRCKELQDQIANSSRMIKRREAWRALAIHKARDHALVGKNTKANDPLVSKNAQRPAGDFDLEREIRDFTV